MADIQKKELLNLDVKTLPPELKDVWERSVAFKAERIPKDDFYDAFKELVEDFKLASEMDHRQLKSALMEDMNSFVYENNRDVSKFDRERLKRLKVKIDELDPELDKIKLEKTKKHLEKLQKRVFQWPVTAMAMYSITLEIDNGKF